MVVETRVTEAVQTPGKRTAGDEGARPQDEPRCSPHSLPMGAIRVAPLNGEVTLSFVGRVVSRYRLTAKELIGALIDVRRRPNLYTVRPDSEVLFNTEARAVLAAFCRMPEDHLRRALPTWDTDLPAGKPGNGPAAWIRTADTIAPTGPGCRACTATATKGTETARRYLLPHGQVCTTHQCWMLETPVVDEATAMPGQLDLRNVPQILAAQRRHVGLLPRYPHTADAFATAQAVTASWWNQPWPDETTWSGRLQQMTHDNAAWRDAARNAATYPEAVTIAAILAEAGAHQPHALADVPARLHRPQLPRATARLCGPGDHRPSLPRARRPPVRLAQPHRTDPAAHEAEPLALHEYLFLLAGHTAPAPPPPADEAGPVPSAACLSAMPGAARQPASGSQGPELSPAEVDALIAASSLGTPGVLDIADRTSDQDATDVMQRLHALRQPPAEPPPADYAFERWIEKSHDLPHALMRLGHSYARQHFNHRADLCFRAALAAGHPDAEQALAALPRTREGLIEPGNGPSTSSSPGHATHPAEARHSPAGAHAMRREADTTPMPHPDRPRGAAQPARGLGWAPDMQAI